MKFIHNLKLRIMSKFKTIEKADVKNAALSLIKKNGKTTNKEIKEELRKNGNWATQSEIASFMDEIESEENLDVTQNGMFRTFSQSASNFGVSNTGSSGYSGTTGTSMGGMKPISVTPSIKTVRVPHSNTTPQKTKASYKWTDAVETTSQVKGDWEVYDTVKDFIVFYKGDCPRYTVRRAFSKKYKSGYIYTRAKRVR